jgi:hypothetical protein
LTAGSGSFIEPVFGAQLVSVISMQTLMRGLLIAFVASVSLAGCRKLAEPKIGDPPVTLDPGSPAPEIEGKDLAGQSFRLSDYRGKVVLLDFWATN